MFLMCEQVISEIAGIEAPLVLARWGREGGVRGRESKKEGEDGWNWLCMCT